MQSLNSSRSEEFYTPPQAPQQGTSKGAVPKLLNKILRGGKTVEFKDPLQDRQSWIQKNLQKMQVKAEQKAEAKRIKAAAGKAHPSGGTASK